jgi:Ca-activated chloride channel homolog
LTTADSQENAMKQLGPIALVVLMLLAAAAFYHHQPPATADTRPVPKLDDGQPVNTIGSLGAHEPSTMPRTEGIDPGTLTLRSTLSHGYLLASNPGEFYAAIDITATEGMQSSRPPLNVALVIDRSGSMGVEAMAQARQAAMQFIEHLDHRDRVAVVSFSRDVRVDYPSNHVTTSHRAEMRRAIDGIVAAGATNISGGFEEGFNQVQRWRSRDTVNRVVLFTDGVPNIGLTSRSELESMARNYLAQGVSMTAIGFGVDYDERLMAAMADQGGGNYYFVNRASAMASIFSRELETLTRSVARGAQVVVELGPDVDVEEVYGFPFQRTGSRLHLSLGEFHAGQSKNILLKLSASASAMGQADILRTRLIYDDLVHDARASQHVAVHAVITGDERLADSQISQEVIIRVQQVEVARSLEQAMEHYERGETARAAEVIHQGRERVERAERRYSLPKPVARRAAEVFEASGSAMKFNEASSSQGREVIIENRAKSRAIQLDSAAY